MIFKITSGQHYERVTFQAVADVGTTPAIDWPSEMINGAAPVGTRKEARHHR
jgi:hypothetical protein